MQSKILLITIVLTLSMQAQAEQVTHIVLVWLDKSLSQEQITKIIDNTKQLSKINYVKSMKVGRAISSTRKIVDDSFTFGIVMKFADIESMNKYLVDDNHVNYVKQLKPMIKKLLVYDF
jgi:hypothetical protein